MRYGGDEIVHKTNNLLHFSPLCHSNGAMPVGSGINTANQENTLLIINPIAGRKKAKYAIVPYH